VLLLSGTWSSPDDVQPVDANHQSPTLSNPRASFRIPSPSGTNTNVHSTPRGRIDRLGRQCLLYTWPGTMNWTILGGRKGKTRSWRRRRTRRDLSKQQSDSHLRRKRRSNDRRFPCRPQRSGGSKACSWFPSHPVQYLSFRLSGLCGDLNSFAKT
jgi:hypothetical protein